MPGYVGSPHLFFSLCFCANSLAFIPKMRAGLARDSATLKGYLVTQYHLYTNKVGVCHGASKLGVAKTIKGAHNERLTVFL